MEKRMHREMVVEFMSDVHGIDMQGPEKSETLWSYGASYSILLYKKKDVLVHVWQFSSLVHFLGVHGGNKWILRMANLQPCTP